MKTTFNKKSVIITMYTSLSVFAIVFTFLAVANYYSKVTFIVFLITALGLFVLLIANILIGTGRDSIEVNKNGIFLKYRKNAYHMEWKNIKMVAISKYGVGKSRKRVIYSTKYDKNILLNIYPYNALSNDLLFMQNRKGLIKEIEKYWGKDIINRSKNVY